MMLRHRASPVRILLLLLALVAASAGAQEEPHPVRVYFFWGVGCPFCDQQKVFLEALVADHPNVDVRDFEVYHVLENRNLLIELAAAFGHAVRGVPMTFIGDEVWVGFNRATGEQMRFAVERYQAYEGPDPADRLPPELREFALAQEEDEG